MLFSSLFFAVAGGRLLARVTPLFSAVMGFRVVLVQRYGSPNEMVSYAAPNKPPRRVFVSEVQSPSWDW